MRWNLISIIGHTVGWLCILLGIILGRVGLGPYLSITSVFITVFGASAAVVISAPSGMVRQISKLIRISMSTHDFNNMETIDLLINLSDRARKDGLLALEDTLVDIPNEFLRKGLQMVIDGTDPDIIKKTLNIQIDEMRLRHEAGANMFRAFGSFCPAFGLIGTIIGLIALLGNIGGEPTAIGRGMQTALVTTLYGTIIANLIAIPSALRLVELDVEETRYYNIILEGITAIQAGDNPRILRDRLLFFLSGEERATVTVED